jgi:hypothetical protein
MVGEGFYTTTSKEIAGGYGAKLYKIRGSKTGKQYKHLRSGQGSLEG